MFSLDIKIKDTGVAARLEKEIEALELEFAENIAEATKEVMASGTRSGRLYRKGSFRGNTKIGGIRARGRGNRIHRASAPGEPLAKETGATERSISVRRLKKGVVRIRIGGGIPFWELRDNGKRPTVMAAVEIAAQKTFG